MTTCIRCDKELEIIISPKIKADACFCIKCWKRATKKSTRVRLRSTWMSFKRHWIIWKYRMKYNRIPSLKLNWDLFKYGINYRVKTFGKQLHDARYWILYFFTLILSVFISTYLRLIPLIPVAIALAPIYFIVKYIAITELMYMEKVDAGMYVTKDLNESKIINN